MMQRLAGWFAGHTHVFAMSAIFLGGLGAGYLCLPGDADRIAMLERDGHTGEALAILEARFKAGDHGQRTLFDLERFYEGAGNVAQARAMLELQAQQRPRDWPVLRQLAAFYRNVEDKPAYERALERLVDLKFSDDTCKELIGLYRLDGDFNAEQAMLTKCRQKGYRRTEDIVRLAELSAVDGDVAQASALLRGVDDLKRLKSERERLALFAILLAADQPREAVRRAARWAKGGRDEGLGLTLVEMLVRGGKPDSALELAREIGQPGDAVSLSVAEVMLDRQERGAAQTYLHGWFDRASLNDERVLARFIDAALDAEDTALALRACDKAGFDSVPEAQLVSLAEALAAIGDRASFETVLTHVSADAIKADPLLQAAAEFARGDRQSAETLIAKVEPDALQDWRLALWARIMESTGRATVADQTLHRLGVEPPDGPVPATDPLLPPAVIAGAEATMPPMPSPAASATSAEPGSPPSQGSTSRGATIPPGAVAPVARDGTEAPVVASRPVAPAQDSRGHPWRTPRPYKPAVVAAVAADNPLAARAHAIRRQRARHSRFHQRARQLTAQKLPRGAPAETGNSFFDQN